MTSNEGSTKGGGRPTCHAGAGGAAARGRALDLSYISRRKPEAVGQNPKPKWEPIDPLTVRPDPLITLYPLGLKAGCPPGINSHTRSERAEVVGWSQRSARGNTDFLYSVQPELLTGVGYALTLTVKVCPPSHDDWKKIRERFFQALRRRELVRMHWVTEWQRRGVPHLHAAVWFKEACHDMIFHWLIATEEYQSSMHAQTAAPIHDAEGWFKYLAKHAARGVAHYQRDSANMPTGWRKTGRMWGNTGDWPTEEPLKHVISWREYWKLRRLSRKWRQAQARQRLKEKHARALREVNRKLPGGETDVGLSLGALRPLLRGELIAIRAARRMLRCNDPKLSPVRGISDWVPIHLSLKMMTSTWGDPNMKDVT